MELLMAQSKKDEPCSVSFFPLGSRYFIHNGDGKKKGETHIDVHRQPVLCVDAEDFPHMFGMKPNPGHLFHVNLTVDIDIDLRQKDNQSWITRNWSVSDRKATVELWVGPVTRHRISAKDVNFSSESGPVQKLGIKTFEKLAGFSLDPGDGVAVKWNLQVISELT